MSVLDEIEQLRQSQQDQTPEVDNTIKTDTETKPMVAESSSNTIAQVESVQEPALDSVIKGAMLNKVKSEEGDIKKLARDLTYMKGASDLQSNDDFTSQYQAELGKQLVQDLKDEGKRQAISDAAKKIEAKNIRNQAFYDGCKPIFRLLGIEEAYGLVPMIITVVLLMVPFLLVSLVRFIINSINSMFVAVSNFKKPAFWICTIIICLVITAVVILLALWAIDSLFGTHILVKAKDIVQGA